MATIGIIKPFDNIITKNMILEIHANIDLNTLRPDTIYSVYLAENIVRGHLKAQHPSIGLYYFEFLHNNELQRIKITAPSESIDKIYDALSPKRRFIKQDAEIPYELTIDGMVYKCHVHGTGLVPFENSFYTISDNGVHIYVDKNDEDLILHRKHKMTQIDISIPVIGKLSTDDSDIVFLNENIPRLSYRQTYIIQHGNEFVEAELVESLTGHPRFRGDCVDAYAVAHETSLLIK